MNRAHQFPSAKCQGTCSRREWCRCTKQNGALVLNKRCTWTRRNKRLEEDDFAYFYQEYHVLIFECACTRCFQCSWTCFFQCILFSEVLLCERKALQEHVYYNSEGRRIFVLQRVALLCAKSTPVPMLLVTKSATVPIYLDFFSQYRQSCEFCVDIDTQCRYYCVWIYKPTSYFV